MELPLALFDFQSELITLTVLVFFRVGAIMAVLPTFGERSIPVRIRLVIAVAFTVLVVPAIAASADPPTTRLFTAAIAEALSGLFFGLGLRFFVFAIQVAGTIAAQSTSLSQIFGGTVGFDPQPAMSQVLVVAALALISLLGFHVEAVKYILISYEIVPMGEMPSARQLADQGTTEVARCFALAFTLAAPFLIASLIYNVTLGVINKAMPQLMVAFVGAPAITAGGLILLLLAAPIILSVWAESFGTYLRNPFGD